MPFLIQRIYLGSRKRRLSVYDALDTSYKWIVTAETIDEIIKREHIEIKVLGEQRVRAIILNPKVAADYDRYVQDHVDSIDFYRWLQPHVSPDGVFYMESK